MKHERADKLCAIRHINAQYQIAAFTATSRDAILKPAQSTDKYFFEHLMKSRIRLFERIREVS